MYINEPELRDSSIYLWLFYLQWVARFEISYDLSYLDVQIPLDTIEMAEFSKILRSD